MKRYLALSAVLSASLYAATDAQILEYFKGQISSPDVKVKVAKREKVKEDKNYELVVIDITKNEKSQRLNLFTRGDFIFPDIIDMKSKKSLLKELEQKAQNEKLKSIYKKEDKKNIISLGHDPKKETLVVFTDPECPYCRQELTHIDSRLKEYNLKLLLTPVHGRSSLEKSHLIYEEIKKAKDDKAKIAIIKKYYAKDVNITDKNVTDASVKAIEELRGKYLGGVIKGVPFIVPEKEIR